MIHLPLACPSGRGASGGHLRRIFTGCGRVSLAHLILRNRFADGGARTGVRRLARMGPVSCDGQPKIAIRKQGLFPVKRSSDRGFLSTVVASGTPRHGGMIAPMQFRLASRWPSRARPTSVDGGSRARRLADANARVLATCRRIWLSDYFPFAGCIGQAVAGLESHEAAGP